MVELAQSCGKQPCTKQECNECSFYTHMGTCPPRLMPVGWMLVDDGESFEMLTEIFMV